MASNAINPGDRQEPESDPAAPHSPGSMDSLAGMPQGDNGSTPPHHIPTEEQKTVISKQPPLVEPRFRFGVNPQELGSQLEGELLDHFRLEEFVGGGGMGAVFRATDTMLGRTVAVKVLSRDQTDDETLRRFRNEAQSAARLDHENIARVYYVGEDRGVNYIVFEFIEGVNIRDLVDHKGPLPLDEAINYTLQVAQALEHAHLRDVVHRDIKPSNILVAEDGRAKLVDMGLARLHHMESASEDITASGVTLGTFDYISPEQARDPRSADVRSDMYSLGCTLYFMLTAQAPFPEGTVLQKLLSHSTDDPPDPGLHRPDLNERTTRILAKMMAKRPSERFQEPTDLIRELVLLADSLGILIGRRSVAAPISRKPSPLRHIKRHVPWVLPILTLLISVYFLGLAWRDVDDSEGIQVDLPAAPVIPPPTVPPVNPESPPLRDAEAAKSSPPQAEAVVSALPGNNGGEVPADPTAAETPREEMIEPAEDSENNSLQRVAAEQVTAEVQVASQASGRVAAGAEENYELSAASETQVDDAAAGGEPAIHTLVVGTLEPPAAGVELASSLSMAVKRAQAIDGLRRIELRFNGSREELPLDVVPGDLTIKAGAGYRPELVFRPNVDGFGGGTAAMIRVLGGTLRWQGVHLRIEVPHEWIDSWTLFQLRGVQRLVMTDCVMTIRNVHEDGSVFHDRVTFIELPGANPAHSHSMDPEAEEAPRSEIRFENCIARGQATLVRVAKDTAFWLVWDQGLFVSTERLIESRGAAALPAAGAQRINLDMENVTVLARSGLCQMAISDKLPYHRELVSNWVNSIVVTDSDAALYEQVGHDGKDNDSLRIVDDLMKRISVRGRDNIYPNTSFILRVNPSSSPGETLNYVPEERKNFDRWYDEMGAIFGARLMWNKTVTSNLSLDQQTKFDYIPRLPNSVNRERLPGFTLSSLPDVLNGFPADAASASPP